MKNIIELFEKVNPGTRFTLIILFMVLLLITIEWILIPFKIDRLKNKVDDMQTMLLRIANQDRYRTSLIEHQNNLLKQIVSKLNDKKDKNTNSGL